ncbi:MAG TPA: imidazolonepropionase [Bryobacteraceae bacterium]|jgi:imidazolonepropionase|nr:imidazolonepropionase [Bryobacteraceae bacterium]
MTTLVRNARQLLTLRGDSGPRRGAALGELGIVPSGAVLIKDGLIVDAGPARRVEKLPAARRAREVDAAGRVVMPGFVDSHTHLVFGRPRLVDYEMRLAGASYAEIAAAGGGILSSVAAVRGMSAAQLEAQARDSLAAMIRHGTTTVEAKSGYALDEAGELKTLRVLAKLNGDPLDIVPTYLGAHIPPPEYRGKADAYIDWMAAEMLPQIRRRKLARFVDIYCDDSAFTLDQSRRYLDCARRLGFGLKIHAEQFARTGAARLAVELDAASADHLEQAGEEDIRALAQSNTIATLLPGSVFHLGLRTYAPARALIEAGAAVALATDFNPGTSPTYSMQMALSLACTEMRMSPAEAIAAATINGAHALRMADRKGSLEPGKDGDVLILNVQDYRELPYYFGANNVYMTIQTPCPKPL